MFFYKNYVGWNKMGITIRIKSFFGETINFKDIKTKEFTNDVLNISKINGNEIKIDLSGIKKSDIDELNNILTKYTIAKNA
jgi:hypothetical protein